MMRCAVAFLAVKAELEEYVYKKEIVMQELLPRCFYLDSEWAQLVKEAEYMGQGVRYIDEKYLPRITPPTGYYIK